MTQISRPWAGTSIGDAGPYTAAQWWDVWQSLVGGSGALIGAGGVGVFYRVPGRLAPTSAGNNSASIAAGAALVDGLYYSNSAAVGFVIPSAAGGKVRADRIVIRKSFSGAVQIARLVLLTGAEVATPGPATPPALTQDTTRVTFWDEPIATFSVTDGGVITVTDERAWVDVSARSVVVPGVIAYDETALARVFSDLYGVVMPVDSDVRSDGLLLSIPSDYASTPILSIIVYSADLPNPAVMRAQLNVDGFRPGITVYSAGSIPATDYTLPYVTTELVCSITLTGIQAGDAVIARFKRLGAHANDTGGSIYLIGAQLSYLGYK